MKEPAQKPYTVREAAERLGVSDKTVYRMAQQRQIPCLRLRGRILIPRPVIEALLMGPAPRELEAIRQPIVPAA